MIIKSLSRKSNSGQLLKYIFRYILDDGKSKALMSNSIYRQQESNFLIRQNVRSRSIKGFIKEFEENESFRLVRRKDSVKIFHNIISFSPQDASKINDKILKDIAKKFIAERGINNLYVGTRHQDKEHIHLHIAVSGTQLNGRSSRVSRQQFHHIKLELDKYQKEKYPALVSLPRHGKGEQDRETILQSIKRERQTQKEILFGKLDKAYTNATSRDHFLSLLAALGHEAYYRNGQLQGILHDGKKFRFSRLGYDDQAIQALDQKDRYEEKQLVELQTLRKENIRIEKEQTQILNQNASDNNIAATAQEELKLNKLSELRSGIEQEMDREVCQPSLFDELRDSSSMLNDVDQTPGIPFSTIPRNTLKPFDLERD